MVFSTCSHLWEHANFLNVRILGAGVLSAYIKQKPRLRRHVLAFRGLVSAAAWRRPKDVEEQFARVVFFDRPDRVTFDFAEENLRIETRVNFTLGLVLIVNTPPAKHDMEKKMNDLIRPIRNDADYQAALVEIGALFNAAPGTAEADRVEVLAVLVADYERRRHADAQPDPIDVLSMSMKGQGRTQADLAALLESRSRASEVLSRRRQLSPSMIEKLAQAWSIPASLLSAPFRVETRLGKVLKSGALMLAIAIGVSAAAIWGMFAWYGANLPDTAQIAATFAGSRVRIPDFAPLDEIPPEVVMAFLAAEDDDFYAHGAYSYPAIVRAGIHNLTSGRREGGATITQQLAKKVFLSEGPSIGRKIKEIILARRIEQALTKDRILEAFFNRTYFGGDQYGIAAASDRYFAKRPADLTIAEAAYLAGVLKAPNTYRLDEPANLNRAKARRNWVLERMADGGWIPVSAARLASDEPLGPTRR
jgi:antitoxin component HigA of HigAB toxin-antitoxin module/mRNA-degrading endonuclease HigB of HigAB toxin-antitoxin module